MTGPELRQRRESARLSRTELAFLMGLTERSIYRYESGQRPITQVLERAISTVLPLKKGKRA